MVPVHFLYLALAGFNIVATVILIMIRPDLRRAAVSAGLVGAGIESISEIWYERDYWHPLTVLPFPAPEDILYGFGVTALAVGAVPFFTNRRYTPTEPTSDRRSWLILLLAGFFGGLAWLPALIGVPSIWIAGGLFFAGGVIGLTRRPELWWVGLIGGVVMGGGMLAGYAISLNWLINGDSYLNQVLVTAGSRWDIRIFGQVPFDEVVWNAARGWCMAILYPVLSGQKLVSRRT